MLDSAGGIQRHVLPVCPLPCSRAFAPYLHDDFAKEAAAGGPKQPKRSSQKLPPAAPRPQETVPKVPSGLSWADRVQVAPPTRDAPPPPPPFALCLHGSLTDPRQVEMWQPDLDAQKTDAARRLCSSSTYKICLVLQRWRRQEEELWISYDGTRHSFPMHAAFSSGFPYGPGDRLMSAFG